MNDVYRNGDVAASAHSEMQDRPCEEEGLIPSPVADAPSASRHASQARRSHDASMVVEGDYPPPKSLTDPTLFLWDADAPPAANYVELGAALARSGDIYRLPTYGGGLLLASSNTNIPPLA